MTVTWPSAWHRLLQSVANAHPDAAPDILLAPLKAALRAFRRREMVRIAVRDLAGICDLDDTMAALSALAAATIDGALGLLFDRMCMPPTAPRGRRRQGPTPGGASAWESWVPVNSIFPRMWT
jgi:glutamine synthetase adenylyltransferase